MMRIMQISLLLVAHFSFALLAQSQNQTSDDIPLEIDFSGWINVDYGNGDRYGESNGDDTLGASQAALMTRATYGKLTGVILLGAEYVSAGGDESQEVRIEDAFVVWREIAKTRLSMTIGSQPLFFGLKSNGYPGDRTIQDSIEFGGGGAFPVANQGGPAIMLHYDFETIASLSLGIFDQGGSFTPYGGEYPGATITLNPGNPNLDPNQVNRFDGSSVYENYLVKGKFEGLFIDEIYAFLGYQGLYVGFDGAGTPVDKTKSIFSAGVGYNNDLFDASIEYFGLEPEIAATADDETYLVVEAAVNINDRLTFTADYATASELEVDTLRSGLNYQIYNPLNLALEYAQDDFDAFKIDSIDVRFSFSF